MAIPQILSVLNAHKTYFHQGYDYFKDTDPFLKTLSKEVSAHVNLRKSVSHISAPT